jgi:hypothetical protein
MARAEVTASMTAHAQVLLERSSRWARGYDTRNGRQFVVFTSSRSRDGQPVLYYTGAAGDGCTCKGFLYRGACSHAEACRIEAEQAREAVGSKPRAKLEDLLDAWIDEGTRTVAVFG